MNSDVSVDMDVEAMRDEVKAEVAAGIYMVAEQVFEKALSSNCFDDKTGNLRRSISLRKSRFKDGGYIVKADSPHAHLVEFGHVQVSRSGRVLGHVPGRFFLRKARNAVRLKAEDIIRDAMGGDVHVKRG